MLIPLGAIAEEDWSSYDNIDNAWDGQKAITNKQFEETMNALQANKKRKEDKKREKAIRKVKGSSLIPQMDAHNDDMINENPDEENVDEGQLINIPVDFVVNGQSVERGFYKVLGEKKNDGVYIMLFQGHDLKAKIKARETNDDFEEQYIQFVKLLPFNDHQMKIIFGSVEFNAVAYINFIEPQSMF